MKLAFSGLHLTAAILASFAIVLTGRTALAAEMPTSAGANACAQLHLSAVDFNECQALWSSARDDAERREVQKRFEARGMIIPGSRRVPVDPGVAASGDSPDPAKDAAPSSNAGRLNAGGRTGAPGNMSASPQK